MSAVLRKAFGERFTPEITKDMLKSGDDVKSVQCNATMLLFSTLPQWIDYSITENENDGMLRRRLVFMPDEDDIADNNGKAPSLLDLDRQNIISDVNYARLGMIADALCHLPKKIVFDMGYEARGLTGKATQILMESGIPQSAWETLITNYATICAAARCAINNDTLYIITPEDIDAVTDILAESVCKSHGKLNNIREMQKLHKNVSFNEAWIEIKEYLGESGKRTDKVNNWLNSRPPVYRDAYKKMESDGHLVWEFIGKDSKKKIRLATDEEIEKHEKEHPKQQKSATPLGKAYEKKEYVDCDDAEKARRVKSYVDAYNKDNALNEGNRNKYIFKLAASLDAAGMKDGIAQDIVRRMALESGLSETETQKVMRKMTK